MKNVKIGLLIIMLFWNCYSIAQAVNNGNKMLPTIFSASPNAASLGAYGQTPVSLFNGSPNTSVPLYTIKVDNFEMPISVSYNLASIKPEERPSWVGLGWNLNAGGAITRIVKGGVDEVVVSGVSNPNVFSYYNYFTELNTSTWSSVAKLAEYNTWLRSVASVKDAPIPAPDEFMFNVNGLSGSFFKNHEGLWVVKANQNIDVKINEELKTNFKLYEVGNHVTNSRLFDIGRIFYGFTLTTDNGIQYVFGKDPNAIEFTASPNILADGKNPNFVAKTWYLTKIILPTGKIISLQYKTNYTSEESTGDTTNKAVFKQYMSSDVMKFWTHYADGRVEMTEASSSGNLTNKILERSYVVYLDKITSPDTEITFNNSFSNDLDYDLSNSPWGQYLQEYVKPLAVSYLPLKHWYKLDNFVVKSSQDYRQVYKAVFKYLENPTSRLFLTGIDESGIINSAVNKKYSFEYNALALPAYNSFKIDHWGYFNDNSFTQSVALPSGSLYYTDAQLRSFYYASRNPNSASLQAGTLTKIIYPTGGFSQFYYEPHDFSKVVDKASTSFTLVDASSTNEIAGGLRIRKIVSDPLNNGNPMTKEYFYVKDYKNNVMASSGILSGRPVYIEEATVPNMHFFKLSSNTFGQLNDTNGSHVTYTNVVEKLQDGSFTEFVYSNHDNGYMDKLADQYRFVYSDATGSVFGVPADDLNNVISKKISFNSLAAERGNLLFEKKFNTQKNIVEETRFTYNDDAGRFTDKIRSIDFSETVIGSLQGDVNVLGGPVFEHIKSLAKMSAYTTYSHQVYLKKKENIVYDLKNNSNITTTTNYTYSNIANHHHLKSEIITSSTGDSMETKYFYPLDTEMVNQPYKADLVAGYFTGIPLSTQNLKASTKISEQRTIYEKGASTSNLLLPKNIYAAKFPNTFTNITIPDIGQLEKKITYDKYDDYGNIQQYTLENGTSVVVLWGYNNTLPIAKIENALYANITASLISDAVSKSNTDTEANLIIALNALRTALPNAMVTSYTYIPLTGISTITDPKGATTYYKYDDYNRLWLVRDQNLNILQQYCYNYKGQQTDCTKAIYFSVVKSGSYTKTGCVAGSSAPPITYTVPAGAYTSTVSQADADSKAQADLVANGQNYANINTSCIFKNVAKSGSFTRNNCGGTAVGSTLIYTVPAAMYTSTISQADADAKAQADLVANGQNYANTNGTCTQSTPVYSYDYDYDSETNQMTITVRCNITAHPQATFNLTVFYLHLNETNRTSVQSVVLPANQLSFSKTFSLLALEIQNVRQDSIVQQ